MSDQNVKIDIELKGLDKLPQYKAGFDNLRDAVNNLNKEITNSTDKIVKLTNQTKENEHWLSKLKTNVLDLANTYVTLKESLKDVAAGFTGWAGAAAVAFNLITTYGPKVLDFLDNLFKTDNAREAARSLEDYKDVMTSYTNNISGEIAEVTTLLSIAKEEKLSKTDRMNAIKSLNELAPEYLKNLTLENLKIKEGSDMINEYLKSLDKKAMQEAIVAKKTDLIKQRYELKEEYSDAKEAKKHNINKKSFTLFGRVIFTVGNDADKKFDEVAKKDYELVRRINKLNTDLTKELLQYKPSKNLFKSKDKDFWDNVLTEQQTKLNQLDSSATDFAKRAKPIRAKMQQAQKMLSLYTDDQSIKFSKSNEEKPKSDPESQIRKASADRMALLTLKGFAREIEETRQHFKKLIEEHKGNKKTVEQLKREEIATLASIRQKFEEEEAKKLDEYHKEITQQVIEYTTDAKQKALASLQQETKEKLAKLDEQEKAILNKENELRTLSFQLIIDGKFDEADAVQKAADKEKQMLEDTGRIRLAIKKEQSRKENEINDAAEREAQSKKEDGLQKGIDSARSGGHESGALKQEIELLAVRHKIEVDAAKKRGDETTSIDAKYAKDKADLEDKLLKSRIHAGDKLIDAVMKNTKKDSAAFKAAFLAKKATAIADTIISTKQSIMESLKAYSGIPFIGQALGIAQAAFMAVQGATSIAEIAKQKPAMARGGRFISDGRGAVLPGYSRTDDTNAYLRSGEAVVVSEAMRNPWARNLVSAINVAHGGRDFSVPNGGRGYAIGGIFTDGGNANRYYSAPVNDQKDLANTLAYQMINNFPPIYVDVKDVNNQQNILAQTVNRVTL